MRRIGLTLLAATGIILVGAPEARAALPADTVTTTQTVTFQVDAINELAVSGNPSLTVNSATAGSAPDAATDASTTWAITTNESSKKVAGDIDSAMPTGVTLELDMQAPTQSDGSVTGTSAGALSLGTTGQDLVTGITTAESSGRTLTYTLTATTDAGTVANTTRTVTLYLVNGA